MSDDKSNENQPLQVRDLRVGDYVEYYWHDSVGWKKFTVTKKTLTEYADRAAEAVLDLTSPDHGIAHSIKQHHVPGRLRRPQTPDQAKAALAAQVRDLRDRVVKSQNALNDLSAAVHNLERALK